MRALFFLLLFPWVALAEVPSYELTVAVSTAMPEALISDYAREAKRFGARLVLRGVPVKGDGLVKSAYFGASPEVRQAMKRRLLIGWSELARLSRETGADFEVDPVFFRERSITAVPEIFFEIKEEKDAKCSSCGKAGLKKLLLKKRRDGAHQKRILGAVSMEWALLRMRDEAKDPVLRDALSRCLAKGGAS